MKEKQLNLIRAHTDHHGRGGTIVMYDKEIHIHAKIENFKDAPAHLTMLQHIDGEWELKKSNLEFELKDAYTLKYEIALPANSKKELNLEYYRRHLR